MKTHEVKVKKTTGIHYARIEAAREIAQSLADCELLPGRLRRRLRIARRPGTLRDALDDAALRPELDVAQKLWAIQAVARLA